MKEELSTIVQLQGLRLLRAFLRIEDLAQRISVIELAERLAGETAASSSSGPKGRAADVITFPDTFTVS